MTTLLILSAVIASLIGALPFGYVIARLWKGVDIRTLGSKNIGATNVMRVLGPGPGILVFVLDVLKGVAAVLTLRLLAPEFISGPLPFIYQILIGIIAVFGHTFSPFLGFRGGKGVATSFGVLLALGWQVGVAGFVVWLLVVGLTRYVSLASLAAAVSLPIAARIWLSGEQEAGMFWLSITLGVLVFIRHRANILRLVAGTEAKIGQRSAPTTEERTDDDAE